MTGFDVLLIAGIFLLLGLVALCIGSAAYRNGVTDGYGFAVEPNCPGYKAAGDYLKKNMKHRWPELGEPQRRPTIAELDAILNSKEELSVRVMPDGSVRAYPISR